MPDTIKKIVHFIRKTKVKINPHPPIVVWQMGKVGSSTVYKSIKSLKLANPVFQIHFLTPENLSRARNEFKKKGLPLPRHIYYGNLLLDRFEKTGGNNWKIITIVRDMPSIIISGFFENINRWAHDHKNLLTKKGNINTEVALQLLTKQLYNFDESRDYVCNWFDREIKQMTKIDVFSHPFDHEKGYTIIKENNIDLLILKTELLNSTFSEAIPFFLNIDRPVQLTNTNSSGEKRYGQAIKQIRNELVIPDDILHKINISKYMKHFYPSNS